MRILIVSYYFPPLGLAGTARPVALANFFAGRGDEVFVVTVKPIAYPAHDRAMEAAIDPRVQVVRVGSTDPARIQHFLPMVPLKKWLGGKSRSTLASSMFPDSKIGFARGATEAVKKLIQPGVKTILVTTSPPMSAHLVGLKSAESENVSWLADFRDIWSSVPFGGDDAERQRRADELYKQIFERAALVTATSPKTASAFADMSDVSDKTMFLPNGFSESDFALSAPTDAGVIAIYGTLNHLVGFERVAQWIGEFGKASSKENFRLHHVGHLDLPSFEKILTDARLQDRFDSTGYLAHPEAVATIRRSEVNVIALSDEHDTSYVVPSKLWELLRAEPPLIAVLPKGNAAREIFEQRRFPGVWIADNSEQFLKALTATLDTSQNHRGLRSSSLCREFEWTNLFTKLSDRLDGMIS